MFFCISVRVFFFFYLVVLLLIEDVDLVVVMCVVFVVLDELFKLMKDIVKLIVDKYGIFKIYYSVVFYGM